MKKIFTIIFIVSLLFLLSCTINENAEIEPIEKQYEITTYSLGLEGKLALMQAFNDVNEDTIDSLIKEIAIGKLNNDNANKIKNKMDINSYNAKEIISFTEKSVRFIDNSNKEIFITSDYLEVKQIK
jgi:hypothetical protein